MPAGVRASGVTELRKALRTMDKDTRKELRAASKRAADIIAKAAAEEAPERSGRLRSSIKSGTKQDRGTVKAGTPSRVPYAGVIHWGWPAKNIQANQFITRALKKHHDEVMEAYLAEVRSIIKRRGLKQKHEG